MDDETRSGDHLQRGYRNGCQAHFRNRHASSRENRGRRRLLGQSQAVLGRAEADLEGFKTAEVDAQTKLTRAKALAARQLITQADFDAAQIAMDEASADVRGATAQVGDARAVIGQSKAALDQASVDLDRTVIHSPIDGIVLARNVDVGQTVAAAVQAPVLFSIATELTHLQVQVDVDESDIGGLQVGQEVSFKVESYPDETFHGTLSQVRLQPIAEQTTAATTIASSTMASTTTAMATVVSYATIIDVENPDQRLRPGMTASVVLSGTRRENVTRIPAGALSFRPSADVFQALHEGEPNGTHAENASGSGTGRSREVWVYDGKRLTPVAVRVGLADSLWTELLSGPIHPGDALVTSAVLSRRP